MRRSLSQLISLFLINCLIFSSVVLFTILFFTNDNWVTVFFSYEFNSSPLVVYLLLFSFVFTGFLFLWIKLIERKKYKRIEQALSSLVKGAYYAPIFKRMKNPQAEVQITRQFDKLFLNLHEKMILMAKEAISLNDQGVKLNRETKEEILEQERHRIARELHDSVSQQLFASSMILSAVNQQKELLPEPIAKQLQTIEEITNEAQSEMRALLLHLRPVKLDNKTLKEGVEQLLRELDTKISTVIKYDIEDIKTSISIEDNLFRIVQELLSNVLRHAKAEELEVYLKYSENDTLQLRVIDDGVGFDMNEERTGSYGLNNIKERISSIGGNVRIVSFKGQGTTVEITIPIGIGGEE